MGEVAATSDPVSGVAAEPFDVRASIVDADGEVDEERAEIYCEALLDRFESSPEARALTGEVHWSVLLLDYARDHFGKTIAELEPEDLDEIVFEIFPRKVSVEPSAGPRIVDELRALFAFVERAFDVPSAAACRRVLDGDAGERLEGALSDPANFGMAKSLVMARMEAGFDPTPEGLNEWVRELNGRAPFGLAAPPLHGADALPQRVRSPADVQRAKNKRKAARKARKKNR